MKIISTLSTVVIILITARRANAQDMGSFLAGLLGSAEVPQGNRTESNFPPCPGECVHAITSILCSKVIEHLYCGATYLRCCVSSDFNFGTVVETSAPLPEEERETPANAQTDYDIYIVTTEAADSNNNIYNNKSQSTLSPPTEPAASTASTSIATPAAKPTSESTAIRRPCPGICVENAFVRYCGTTISYGICDEGFGCCASSSSDHEEPAVTPSSSNFFTRRPNDVPPSSKGTVVPNMAEEATTEVLVTTPNEPICPGSCVAPLFSLLCDIVKENFYCPNDGRCCVAAETTTTTEPPIIPCPGACIPTFLSGMCNKPGELLVRTDCDEGFICCYEPIQSVSVNQHRPLLRPPQSQPASSGIFHQHPHVPPVRMPPLQRPYPDQTRPHHPVPRPPNNHPYSDRPHTRPNVHVHGPPPPRPSIYEERPPLPSQDQHPPHIPLIHTPEKAKPPARAPQIMNVKPVEKFSPQLPSQSHPDRLTPVRIIHTPVTETPESHSQSSISKRPIPSRKTTTIAPQRQPLSPVSPERPITNLSSQPSNIPEKQITTMPSGEQLDKKGIHNQFSSPSATVFSEPIKPHNVVAPPNEIILESNPKPSTAHILGPENVAPAQPHHEKPRKPPMISSGQSSFIPISFLPKAPPPNGEQVDSNRRPPRPQDSGGTIVRPIPFGPDGTPVQVIVKPAPHRPAGSSKDPPPCPGPCIASFLKFTCFGQNAVYNGFSCTKAGTMCCAPVEHVEKHEQTLKIADSSFGGQPDAFTTTKIPQASKSVSPYVCGVKGNQRRETPRVLGRHSVPGEWCWQVALINANNQYLCGGALIGSRWVLTAAHCITTSVRNGEPIFIRAGDYDLASQYGTPGAQTQKVSTSYIHHNHNGQTLDNDIALLRLENPAKLNDNVCLVCLPARGATSEPGKRCIVTGYGYESEEGPIALKIREAVLPIVPDKRCVEQVNNVTEKIFILPTGSFCAGGEEGNDACQGDGGGPLVCENEGFFDLMGLVSWGFGCGKRHVPGVYVKVSSFIGWINQIISVNN